MKFKAIILTIAVLMTLCTGCNKANPSVQPTPTPKGTTDTGTTASIVDNEGAFLKAISSNGTWIIAILHDMTINKDLVLDGEYKNGKKDANGNDIIQRKVALYSQDANKVVTARYTLTAPKITINSPNGSLEHGTFKGDVYVSAKGFKLIDQKIDGNVYFTTDDAKSTFTMDSTSSITGKQELKK